MLPGGEKKARPPCRREGFECAIARYFSAPGKRPPVMRSGGESRCMKPGRTLGRLRRLATKTDEFTSSQFTRLEFVSTEFVILLPPTRTVRSLGILEILEDISPSNAHKPDKPKSNCHQMVARRSSQFGMSPLMTIFRRADTGAQAQRTC